MPLQFPDKPEIMSPAGYWPQLHAAVEAGANSVYFGLKHFTARAKVGFTLEELPEVMRTLHRRGVRGYVTFNTLVFEHELEAAARTAAAILEAGADALIVQDLGVLRAVRAFAPDAEIHGSTQMSITDAAGVRLAQRFGVSRVTLARELSLAEVRRIRSECDAELEIFVHGALCVAYSGQCFSSEAWGGRSANRGQCAQACRMPYEMLVDGQHRPLGDARYLLSPGDLLALHHIPEIVGMGLSALKIEGRYKDAEYVALTTRAYRQAVDAAAAPADHTELEQVYSRGLGPWFLEGTNHQTVVQGRAPRHRGVLMGRVRRTGSPVVVEPAEAHSRVPLKPGDGVVFDAAAWRSPEKAEEGGRVYGVTTRPDGTLEVTFARGAIDAARIRPGDLLWRTHDPAVERAAQPYLTASAPVARQPVSVRVRAFAGEPLESEWRAGRVVVRVTGDRVLPAQARPITRDQVAAQLGRLGGTPYELAELMLESDHAFVPVSQWNALRREAVERMQREQERPPSTSLGDPSEALASLAASPVSHESADPELHLLVRSADQLKAALELRPASITLDYLDLYGLKPSVQQVRDSGIAARVAAPRVLKPGEDRVIDFLLRLEAPILVRSTGLIAALRGRDHAELTGDFSLNAANSLTAATLLQLGLTRITPGYDLNADQIAELARKAGAAHIEAIVWSHLPVFHTEHCVFCRFLSTGTTYRDCGRPCEAHRVALRDGAGRAHPVMADVGCRNTVFGAEAQEASVHLDAWLAAGIRHFRLEFVHETADQVRRVVRAFERGLTSRDFRALGTALRHITASGTTQGSLFVPAGYRELPVLQ